MGLSQLHHIWSTCTVPCSFERNAVSNGVGENNHLSRRARFEGSCFRILQSHLFMCATDQVDVAYGWIKANLSAGDCVTSQVLH